MKGSREKFLAESGADDYVSKPILSADELIARVRTLLRKGSHAVSPAARR
jgi:DNA-binding response OmpR family regulator